MDSTSLAKGTGQQRPFWVQ